MNIMNEIRANCDEHWSEHVQRSVLQHYSVSYSSICEGHPRKSLQMEDQFFLSPALLFLALLAKLLLVPLL